MTLHSIWDGNMKYMRYMGGGCRQHHLGLPRGCSLPWHLGGGNGIVNISYRRVIVRWVFADHQMMSPSMGWRYRQHRLWKIHLRYIRWGIPCHDILDALEETFWGGVVSPRPSEICCSMTSGRGQSHRQYRQWKKHLEVGVVSPPSPGAGVLYGRSSRAFQTDWPWVHVGHGEVVIVGGWSAHPQCIGRCWHREPGDAAGWSRAEQHGCRGTLMRQNARPWHLRLWYDPLCVRQVLHISKWTLAKDVPNLRTRRTQLDRYCQHAWMGTERFEELSQERLFALSRTPRTTVR